MGFENGVELLSELGYSANTFVASGEVSHIFIGRGEAGIAAIKVPPLFSTAQLTDDRYIDSLNYLRRESLAFNLVRGVPGIPTDVSLYEINASRLRSPSISKIINTAAGYHGAAVIVQSYAIGPTLAIGKKLSPIERDYVQETVRECHKRGIAGLSIDPRHIILSSMRPVLVGIGNAIFERDSSYEAFEAARAQDERDIASLSSDEVVAINI